MKRLLLLLAFVLSVITVNVFEIWENFLLFKSGYHAMPIANGVIGQPEVRCGLEAIGISIHTEAPFRGQ